MVVGARRVHRRGCGGVGQDVDEVWIHHVVVKQIKDAHPIRSICKGKHAETLESDCRSTLPLRLDVALSATKRTRIYGIEVRLWSVSVDLHHGWGGEHQDVSARCVLRSAQLRCLHVECGAATKHRTCWHGVCQDEMGKKKTRFRIIYKKISFIFSLLSFHQIKLKSLRHFNHFAFPFCFYLAWWQKNPGAPWQPGKRWGCWECQQQRCHTSYRSPLGVYWETASSFCSAEYSSLGQDKDKTGPLVVTESPWGSLLKLKQDNLKQGLKRQNLECVTKLHNCMLLKPVQECVFTS